MSPDPADPRLTDAEVDARFADLVADWDPSEPPGRPDEPGSPVLPTAATAPAASEPGTETDAPPADRGNANPALPARDDDLGPPRDVGSPPQAITLSFPVWRGASGPSIEDVLAAEEDEGFIPPPVTLPPAEDLHYWGAVLGLVAGPLIVIWVVLAHPFYATWWALAGAAMFVAGFLLLVLRGPGDRDPEDDDNGARV